jgi:hypothetical protein
MTPRSLFNIILKVLGIFFLKNILVSAANIIPAIPLITEDEFRDVKLIGLVIIILEALVHLLVSCLLLFKTNWIIDKLRLDQGFQQDAFNLNIHRSIILRIVTIVLGGLIIIDAFPLLVQQLIYFIRMKKQQVPNTKIDYVILHTIKLLIGIFLISYNRFIVNFVEYKRKEITS